MEGVIDRAWTNDGSAEGLAGYDADPDPGRLLVHRDHAPARASKQRAGDDAADLSETLLSLRILTYVHSLDSGGVERIALRLIQRWRKLGIDAPLYVVRSTGDMRDDTAAGMEFMTHGMTRRLTGWAEALWMMLILPSVVRRVRPDVIFCAGNTYMLNALLLKLRLGRSCPPIMAKISNDLVRADKKPLKRLLYRAWLRLKGHFLDQIVAMSKEMVPEIRRYVGARASRINVIPDPALSEANVCCSNLPSAPHSPLSRGRHFVAVGRLVPQKNIALLLRAFAAGGRSEDRLTIIGEGPERAALEALADRLNLGNRVKFMGYVAKPQAILCTFDVLVLSSNYEGVPAVIIEALAAGLPIIATDCCASMAALLGYGRVGELVPVKDEHSMSAAIRRAPCERPSRLEDPWWHENTIENASLAYLRVAEKAVRVQRYRPTRSWIVHRGPGGRSSDTQLAT